MSCEAISEACAMKSIYFENDDILQVRVSDKPIVREVSQDWHTLRRRQAVI